MSEYYWLHPTEDKLYIVARDEEEDGTYTVGLLICLKNEADQHLSVIQEQLDSVDEADSVWESWKGEEE